MENNYNNTKDYNIYKDIEKKRLEASNTLANKILQLRILTDSKGVVC